MIAHVKILLRARFQKKRSLRGHIFFNLWAWGYDLHYGRDCAFKSHNHFIGCFSKTSSAIGLISFKTNHVWTEGVWTVLQHAPERFVDHVENVNVTYCCFMVINDGVRWSAMPFVKVVVEWLRIWGGMGWSELIWNLIINQFPGLMMGKMWKMKIIFQLLRLRDNPLSSVFLVPCSMIFRGCECEIIW